MKKTYLFTTSTGQLYQVPSVKSLYDCYANECEKNGYEAIHEFEQMESDVCTPWSNVYKCGPRHTFRFWYVEILRVDN